MAATLNGPQSERYASCLTRFTELLFPLVWSENDRKAFLSDAYLTNNSWFMRQVDLHGASDPFCAHFLETLLGQDCVLLEPLRPVLLRHYGGDRTPDIEQLLADLRQLCQRQQAPAAVPQPLAIPQTAADAANRPTLFLSYAREEESVAAQLRHNLARYGHLCWQAPAVEKGGDAWLEQTAVGLNNAYAVLLLAGEQTGQDRWVQLEMLAALEKRKPLYVLQLDGHTLPPLLPPTRAAIPLDSQPDAAFQALLRQIPSPPAEPLQPAWGVLSPDLARRAAELVYMDRLKLKELYHVAEYTRLSGQAEVRRSASGRLQLERLEAQQRFDYLSWPGNRAAVTVERRQFSDAVAELKSIRRAVLLGDPGSGKTTTFYKLAADLIESALADPAAPVPLLVGLGRWTDSAESLLPFLQRSVGELGEGLDKRLAAGRAALLLDGINEIPAGQQAVKYAQVRSFLAQYPDLLAWVSCREQDYPADRDLRLDRVTVAPLDALRVQEFSHNYLDDLPDFGREAAADLFWQLAGAKARETHRRFMAEVGPKLPDPERTFWLDGQLPDGLKWGYENWTWKNWLKERARPASLLLLATNPYMLYMLLRVYQQHRVLPANRGQLFDWFVERLLVRERLFAWDKAVGGVVRQAAGEALLVGLTELAYEMQRRTATGREAGALTALPFAVVAGILDERQRYQAASANLLALGDEVRFTHQLLQEYFVARAMRERIFPGSAGVSPAVGGAPPLLARDIWQPKNWWEPTNWEEATILLAGLYSDNCMPVLLWLAEAQPELAARCIIESGAHTPEATKLHLREMWLPRLTGLKHDPDARARAAVGRALGRVTLEDGTPLDNRPGVGFVLRNGLKIPGITWGEEVPAGKYTIGGDKEAEESDKRPVTIPYPYRLARYPVTNAQFACFVAAPDFGDGRWWRGLPDKERQIDNPYFPYANGPRETVSWYQAVAFCRWLSDKLGYTVELPHEYEWEVAARWPDNRFYPWGNKFDAAKANTIEGNNVGEPTAVGLYPHGANSKLNLYDLSGNVWEWCRNKYDTPDDERIDDSDVWRVLRGGSFDYVALDARAAYRDVDVPGNRSFFNGFRVVVVVRRSPSHHEH